MSVIRGASVMRRLDNHFCEYRSNATARMGKLVLIAAKKQFGLVAHLKAHVPIQLPLNSGFHFLLQYPYITPNIYPIIL